MKVVPHKVIQKNWKDGEQKKEYEKTKKPFKCRVCLERFKNKKELKRHFDKTHPVLYNWNPSKPDRKCAKKIICEYCDMELKDTYELHTHLLDTHYANPKNKQYTKPKNWIVPSVIICEGRDYMQPEDHGWIYFLQSEDKQYTKIGLTRKPPDQRTSEVATALPFKIGMIHTIETNSVRHDENIFHKHFTKKGKHTNGEWFTLTDTDIDSIKNYGIGACKKEYGRH